uniref:Short-chain dehydrogenase/reductase SDR n=1 Tax=Rhodopseudomonas palustris (strain BisA53) TaxID=316055 RepID=Q07JY2_RHOP5
MAVRSDGRGTSRKPKHLLQIPPQSGRRYQETPKASGNDSPRKVSKKIRQETSTRNVNKKRRPGNRRSDAYQHQPAPNKSRKSTETPKEFCDLNKSNNRSALLSPTPAPDRGSAQGQNSDNKQQELGKRPRIRPQIVRRRRTGPDHRSSGGERSLRRLVNRRPVNEEEFTMQLKDVSVLITGGGSGLGAATARAMAAKGAKVAVLDMNKDNAEKVAAEIGGVACVGDVSEEAPVKEAIAKAEAANGVIRVLVNCAGIGGAVKTVGKQGAYPLDHFSRIIKVNLIGSFNCIRLVAERMQTAPPIGEERGVCINTASVAAFDGQVGQAAYSASKGGIVGMTLPVARDLASLNIRVMTIAPGLFLTPLLMGLSEEAQKSLGAQVPHPARLGDPSEYAMLAVQIVENPMLNGETIRLDGAIRMAPR